LAATFRLRTLGGALIEGPSGPLTGAVTQRRRLAVLSLLAANGGGISRDRLVGYLWPESDDERARHTLAQLLYGLRQELGNEVIAGSATALRLNADVISSDIQEFEEARSLGDHRRVAELYLGAFLDGFYLSGCDEFERWVDEERRRTLHVALGAIESLAKRATESGDVVGAVQSWRRVAALSPFDSRVALEFIQSMVAAGDPAGAMRHAQVHETLVHSELGLPPDPAIAAFLADPGSVGSPATPPGPTVGSSRTTSPTPSLPAVGAGAAGSTSVAEPTARVPPANQAAAVRGGIPPADRPAPGSVVARPPRRRTTVFVIGGAGLALAGVVAILAMGDDVPSQPDRIVIADVENSTGDPVFDRTVPVALAATIGQSPRVYIVPPERIRETLAFMRRSPATTRLDEATAMEVGVREGARAVIVPAIAGEGGAYEISARIINPETGQVLGLTHARTQRREQLLDALDDLGRTVRRSLGETAFSVATRSVPLPRVTTSSIDALKKYADGSEAFAQNRLLDAQSLWQQAIAVDTGFATAWAALGMLYYWTNRPSMGDSSFTRALAHLDPLPERDQVLIRAQVEGWQGKREDSSRRLRVYVTQHPQDLYVWARLGYDYLRMGRGDEAAEAFERVIALDTLDYETLINLATIEKRKGQFDEALGHYRRAFHIAPGLETSNGNLNLEYGGTYVQAGDLEAASAVFEKMLAGDPGTRARGLRSIAFLAMYQGHYTEATRHLREAVLLTRVLDAGVSELRNRLLLASALEQLGQAAEAAAQRDSAFAICKQIDAEPTLLYWTGKALARAGHVDRTAALLESLNARVHEGSATDRAAAEGLLGELLVARGRSAEGVAHLEIALRSDSTTVVLESLAHAASAAGSLERSARLYEELSADPSFGWEGQEAWRMALYWLGRVQEQRADAALAARAYEQFIDGWRDAEPTLIAVADARDRLARLRTAGASR
jgi:DNA-binding SARP family transcriptional activator/tetratricopeptide (TPR) repeat protein